MEVLQTLLGSVCETFSEPVSLLRTLTWSIGVLVPSLMVGWALPHKARFWSRVVLAAVLVGFAVQLLVTLAYVTLWMAGVQSYEDASMVIGSAFVLALCYAATVACLEASPWQALFCVGAGYSIQNIGSGVNQLVVLAVRAALDAWPALGQTWLADLPAQDGLLATLVLICCHVAVVFVAYWLFVRQIQDRGLDEVEDHKMLAMLFFVMFAVIVFDVLVKGLDDLGMSLVRQALMRLVHLSVCAFALFVQFEMLYGKALEATVEAERRAASERERQYELSRQNIDAINQKCHDIRHQIRRLADGSDGAIDQGFVAEVEREVAVYDSQVRTGNEALDTILTEKGLVCEREGVSLTCIADGEALSFLEPSETYSLFGNALDNAIRAVRGLGPDERRSISVVVRRAGELASIHVENGCAREVAFEDGLPLSDQRGEGHGFGTRSMRSIVERHGGTIAFGMRGGVFVVNAFMPLR